MKKVIMPAALLLILILALAGCGTGGLVPQAPRLNLIPPLNLLHPARLLPDQILPARLPPVLLRILPLLKAGFWEPSRPRTWPAIPSARSYSTSQT